MSGNGLAWKFRAVFVGFKPAYLSRDVRVHDPGWSDEEFTAPIASLEFFLPTGHKVLMAGMISYNFFIEASQAFSRRGGARLEAVWLAGRYPGSDVVAMWRIGGGQVIHKTVKFGQEWGGTAIRGWKPGDIGAEPISTLVRVN